MHLRVLTILTLAILLGALVSCGGSSGSADPDLNFNPGIVDVGPMDADAAIAADEAADTARGVSATFLRFFTDSVNDQSWGRWTVENNSGYKSWSLYSTANTPPKSWILGGNYWNREDDILTSNSFVITEAAGGIPRGGVALTFYSRWNIFSGDTGAVEYRYGADPWTTLASFTAGSNPSYPAWDKYYYQLPPTLTTDAQVRFTFNSDTLVNAWGFGVDNVTVYQTNLNPPASLAATDFLPGGVTITWNDNNAGTLVPETYEIYRSDIPGGPYGTFIGSVPYGGINSINDPAAPFVPYYYVAIARRSGYDDSVISNEDFGASGP